MSIPTISILILALVYGLGVYWCYSAPHGQPVKIISPKCGGVK